jgi:hypothetical protein
MQYVSVRPIEEVLADFRKKHGKSPIKAVTKTAEMQSATVEPPIEDIAEVAEIAQVSEISEIEQVAEMPIFQQSQEIQETVSFGKIVMVQAITAAALAVAAVAVRFINPLLYENLSSLLFGKV